MTFISVHEVRKIAARKGYTIERNGTVKNVTYVRLTGPDGVEVEAPGVRGMTLAAANRLLEQLPDSEPPRPKRRRGS
jgi:hypothetical protein